jgi:hypothetical protein
MPQAGKIKRFFFDFLKKDFSTKCEIFLTASPPFLGKIANEHRSHRGGDTFLNLPTSNPRTPPPFVENVIDLSKFTKTKHKKKSQTEKV